MLSALAKGVQGSAGTPEVISQSLEDDAHDTIPGGTACTSLGVPRSVLCCKKALLCRSDDEHDRHLWSAAVSASDLSRAEGIAKALHNLTEQEAKDVTSPPKHTKRVREFEAFSALEACSLLQPIPAAGNKCRRTSMSPCRDTHCERRLRGVNCGVRE